MPLVCSAQELHCQHCRRCVRGTYASQGGGLCHSGRGELQLDTSYGGKCQQDFEDPALHRPEPPFCVSLFLIVSSLWLLDSHLTSLCPGSASPKGREYGAWEEEVA